MHRRRPQPSFTHTLRQFAPGLASIGIALASFLPGSVKHFIRSRGPLHDVYHLAAFAGLAILLCTSGSSTAKRLRLLGLAILLGTLVEVAEAARNCGALEQMDVLCDTAGVFLGYALTCATEIWQRRQAPRARVPFPPPSWPECLRRESQSRRVPNPEPVLG